MIKIVNFPFCNYSAVARMLKLNGFIYEDLDVPVDIQSDDVIILPGVGSFDWAMTKLNDSGMRDTLDTLVIEKKVPVIGICVGMQIMANKSEEGTMNGLGWLDAEIKKFDPIKNNKKLLLPHMGWNNIQCCKKNTLFNGLESNARFYFLHSYYFKQSTTNQVLTKTSYGESFTSCANKENIFAVQFHPEKSHQWGERLLKNFSEI